MAISLKPKILEMLRRFAPAFSQISSTQKGHWYRNEGHPPYFEFIVISSSQKERILRCDLAWGYFHTWNGSLGTHQMTASKGLPNLRLGSNMIPAQECFYEHDGTEDGIRRSLDRIGSELATYALPWFQMKAQEAEVDQLLQHGWAWIRNNEGLIPATIRDDMNAAFVRAGHLPWRVELPVFEMLKNELRDFAAKTGASSEQRKETAILAMHLLFYAGDQKSGPNK